MYSKYNYLASSGVYDILADVVLILTGTTNVATLSAACDDANTTIANTYANAGWTVHDDTANSLGTVTFTNGTDIVNKTAHGLVANEKVSFTTTGGMPTGLSVNTTYYVKTPNGNDFQLSATAGGAAIDFTTDGTATTTLWSGRRQILKAAVADDAAFYKYLGVDTVTANQITLALYESWNATTHTATNQSNALAANRQQRINTTSGGTLHISSSARHCLMLSITSDGVGSSLATYGNEWTGVFERTRLAPWDTTTAAYPPTVLVTGGNFGVYNTSNPISWYAPRIKNPAGGDLTGVSAPMEPVCLGWSFKLGQGVAMQNGMTSANNLSGAIVTKIPDGLGGFKCPFTEIFTRNPEQSFEGGSCSALSDVWLTVGYAQNLDEVAKDGKTYILWQNNMQSTAITNAGSANIAIPKG